MCIKTHRSVGPLSKLSEEDLNCLTRNPLHTLESDTLHAQQARTLAHSFGTCDRYGIEDQLSTALENMRDKVSIGLS